MARPPRLFILTGRYRVHFWLGVFILGNLIPVFLLTQGLALPRHLALLGCCIREIFVGGQSIRIENLIVTSPDSRVPLS